MQIMTLDITSLFLASGYATLAVKNLKHGEFYAAAAHGAMAFGYMMLALSDQH